MPFSARYSPRQWSTFILIAAFWGFAFAMLSLRSAVMDSLPFDVLGPRRLATAAFGVLLCLGMVWILPRLRVRPLFRWILWAVVGAMAMAGLLALFALTMNRVVIPLPGLGPFNTGEFIQWVLIWLGYCLAWTGTHLALTYHWEMRDEQERAAAMTALAQEARIAALRYQINPHFLFNTLNSISALVTDQRTEEAETMLLNLSAFVRSTYMQEPRGTIALRDEIELQRLYLAIEQTRFSDRLRVVIDLPDALGPVTVPALILQPLVENALRHGVGRSEDLTTVSIRAERAGDILRLIVEDDGTGGDGAVPGTGVGLRNVRERIQAHFGEQGRFSAGPRAEGGFRVLIELPLEGCA